MASQIKIIKVRMLIIKLNTIFHHLDRHCKMIWLEGSRKYILKIMEF